MTQAWFRLQVSPQAPQLFTSETRVEHVPPQLTAPALHKHTPELQVPGPQEWAQAPQFVASVARLAHEFPQFTAPALQVNPHAAPAQVAVPFGTDGQARAQEPQWAGSVARSEQTVPQFGPTSPTHGP